MNGLDGAGITERERNLDLPRAVRNHFCGEALAQARQFGKEAAIVGINRERPDLDALDEIERIRPGDDFALRFCDAAQNSHLDAVACS